MKSLFIILLTLGMAAPLMAQPTKRRATTSTEAAQQRRVQPTDRAAMLFPGNVEVSEDVVWKRDIYRQLDLMQDANAPLYYPIEPQGTQVNLFTYLFRLMLTGRVSAYNYKLDGNESFAAKDRITNVKELLDRYYIYYEDNNGRPHVADTDVPAAQ